MPAIGIGEMADPAVEGILKAAERLDMIVIAGATLSGVVVALRVLGREDFEFQNIKIDLDHYWVVCILLTVAHGYFSYVFADRVEALISEKPQMANEAWDSLSSNGPIMMQGLRERVLLETLELPFGFQFVLYDMKAVDPTTILAVGFISLLLISLLPHPRQIRWDNPTIWLSPAVIPFVNWSLGSYWAISAMALAS